MKETTKKHNFYSALICVALGMAVIATSRGINAAGSYDPLGPSRYPMVLGLLIAVMGVMLFFPAFRDRLDDDEEPVESFSFRNFVPLIGIFICCGFYLLVLEVIGFLLTNIITLTGFTFILGERKLSKILSFSVITSVTLYVLFKYLLGVLLAPMPFLNI